MCSCNTKGRASLVKAGEEARQRRRWVEEGVQGLRWQGLRWSGAEVARDRGGRG